MKETIAPQLPGNNGAVWREGNHITIIVFFIYLVHIHQPFIRAIQNDNLRSMPNSFLPPLPNSKLGTIARQIT